MNIYFVGKVSSGKSSLLNSIVGGFVTNVSLLRETIKITKYHLSTKVNDEKNIKYFLESLNKEHMAL